MSQEQQQYRSRDLPSLSRYSRGLRTGEPHQRSLANTARSMSAFLPNRKYENVEKIAAVYEQVKRDQAGKSSYGVSTATAAERAQRAQRVMEGFKEKIRANFNTLYLNYDDNRGQITSEIRAMQKNKTVDSQMNNKFEQTLREKSKYDRLRAQVKEHEVKLQRLKEVLEKEKDFKFQSDSLKEQLDQKLEQLERMQHIRDTNDYHKAVLNNMREERRNLRNVVKARFVEGWRNWCRTNKLINRYWNEAEAKKIMQHELALRMPGEVLMPEKLAMNLETRLEEFYGKQAYLNIFEHQNILNEEANRAEQLRLEEAREDERRKKEQEDRKIKKEYEEVDSKVLLFRNDQEKIRKVCGINDINQMSRGLLLEQGATLQEIKEEYEHRLREIEEENAKLLEEVQRVLSSDARQEQDLRAVKKEYLQEHQEEKKLCNQAQKCNSHLEELMFIVERVTEEPGTKKDMNMMLAAFSAKMERLVLAEKIERPTNTTSSNAPRDKPYVIRLDTTQKEDWQEASHEEEQQEYVNAQFNRNKAQMSHQPQ